MLNRPWLMPNNHHFKTLPDFLKIGCSQGASGTGGWQNAYKLQAASCPL
jgi:hypothetical protein